MTEYIRFEYSVVEYEIFIIKNMHKFEGSLTDRPRHREKTHFQEAYDSQKMKKTPTYNNFSEINR